MDLAFTTRLWTWNLASQFESLISLPSHTERVQVSVGKDNVFFFGVCQRKEENLPSTYALE